MLMLMGSIIFVNENFTVVEVLYLLLFMDLDRYEGYNWGSVVLVIIYKYLGDASIFSCK